MTSHQIKLGKTTENTQIAIISFSPNSIVYKFVICLSKFLLNFEILFVVLKQFFIC
jgi:hypothetical protein